MLTNSMRAAVLALAIMTPVALHAQRGVGAGGRGRIGGAGNPVAPLIDMRRELNLSARQLVQLDSIERTLLQRNEALRGRLRTRLDSLRPRNRQSSEEEIARFRAEGDSLRALRQVMVRNDSVARVGAMAVLTDSQRVRVRERMAERRGFESGRMSTMRGQGGMRGRQGMQGPRMRRGGMGMGGGGQMGMGGGGRMGMGGGGRMGMGGGMRMGGRGMVGPGMRGRGGMDAPDAVAPRLDRRQAPDDSLMPMRRFRRQPMDDSTRTGPAPRRRPPANGTQ